MNRDQQEELRLDLDALACELHNTGSYLLGNTYDTDLIWLAKRLFQCSRLGAGDVRTTHWLLEREQWEALELKPEGLMGAPNRLEQLTDQEQEAWLKLARIVAHVMPFYAERVGRRFMMQAKAIRATETALRQQDKEQ